MRAGSREGIVRGGDDRTRVFRPRRSAQTFGRRHLPTIPISAFGLDDMAGNVWEWCSDALGATGRVIRGGGFWSGAWCCRAAGRFGDGPGDRSGDLGFRVAAVPSSK